MTDKLAALSQLMEDNINTSANCVESGQQAQVSEDVIYQQMLSISDLTTQVSTATEQQTVVVDEINRNVQRVSELAQQLAESDVISRNVDLLNQQAQEICHLADTFKSR